MRELSQARLQQLLDYSPETGIFTRRVAAGTAKAGDVTGSRRPDGYLLISLDNEQYLAHRLAWLFVHGEWPPHHTDHIDGDRQNNRIANLRPATAAENGANTGPQANNTSGAKGVYWSRIRRKWVAQIGRDRRVINLGGFDTLDEAIAARRTAEINIQGEFRCRAS